MNPKSFVWVEMHAFGEYLPYTISTKHSGSVRKVSQSSSLILILCQAFSPGTSTLTDITKAWYCVVEHEHNLTSNIDRSAAMLRAASTSSYEGTLVLFRISSMRNGERWTVQASTAQCAVHTCADTGTSHLSHPTGTANYQSQPQYIPRELHEMRGAFLVFSRNIHEIALTSLLERPPNART